MWCDGLSKKIIKNVTVYINKKDISENNYSDIEEKDIKLVIDKTDLNRKRAIEELQKNDIVTVLMKYMK